MAFVQAVVGTGNAGTGNSASVTVSAVGSGHSIVGCISFRDATAAGTVSVTDNQSNAYTVSAGVLAPAGDRSFLYRLDNITNAPTVITASTTQPSANVSFMQVGAAEYSGVAFDTWTSPPNEQTTPGTTTDAITSGNISTTGNGNTIVGVTWGNVSHDAIVHGTGFTLRINDSFVGMTFEDLIQSSAGTIAATFTDATDGGASHYLTGVFSLKVPGSPYYDDIIRRHPHPQLSRRAVLASIETPFPTPQQPIYYEDIVGRHPQPQLTRRAVLANTDLLFPVPLQPAWYEDTFRRPAPPQLSRRAVLADTDHLFPVPSQPIYYEDIVGRHPQPQLTRRLIEERLSPVPLQPVWYEDTLRRPAAPQISRPALLTNTDLLFSVPVQPVFYEDAIRQHMPPQLLRRPVLVDTDLLFPVPLQPAWYEDTFRRSLPPQLLRHVIDEVIILPATVAAAVLWFDDVFGHRAAPQLQHRSLPLDLLFSVPIQPVWYEDTFRRAPPPQTSRPAILAGTDILFPVPIQPTFYEDSFRRPLPPQLSRRVIDQIVVLPAAVAAAIVWFDDAFGRRPAPQLSRRLAPLDLLFPVPTQPVWYEDAVLRHIPPQIPRRSAPLDLLFPVAAAASRIVWFDDAIARRLPPQLLRRLIEERLFPVPSQPTWYEDIVRRLVLPQSSRRATSLDPLSPIVFLPPIVPWYEDVIGRRLYPQLYRREILARTDLRFPIAPPAPPVPIRVPSGHNIFVSPPFSLPLTTVSFGIAPQVPPQLNEPGVTIYFSIGGPGAVTADMTLVFTKPSGASYQATPAFLYLRKGSRPAEFATFDATTYLVYTFAAGELNELGLWRVVAQRGDDASDPAFFTVVRNVSM